VRRAVVWCVFGSLLLVGVVAQGWIMTTGALFVNAHDGQGSVAAASDFGGGGGGSVTADAGGPYTVNESETITLDGTGSTTSKGNIDSYSWTITGGNGSLSGANTANPDYQAPSNVDSDTTVTVELTVSNNQGGSDTDTATITINDTGAADVPSVDSLTVTKTGNQNRNFTIDADVSDPAGDGDTLSTVTIDVIETRNGKTKYINQITVSGDSDTILDTTGKLGNGKQYRIEVTVTDDNGDSDTATRTKTTG